MSMDEMEDDPITQRIKYLEHDVLLLISIVQQQEVAIENMAQMLVKVGKKLFPNAELIKFH